MDTEEPKQKTYLGFDFSTQQVKALLVGPDLKPIHEAAVQFDSELPEFRTHGGKLQGNNGEITSPVVMWIKALDMVLDKLRVLGTDFSSVCGISGCGQQNGSVWWKRGSIEALGNLDPGRFLHHQLNSSLFSKPNSPIWMDTSTTLQCRDLEKKIGGPQELANITGSRAVERFTGNQIAKVYQNSPEIYKNTERISLVSSFACSLFMGQYAPIDFSDGSGMNLLDIRKKDWNDPCLELCGPGLRDLLGAPVPSHTVVGNICDFFVQRYNFDPECKVVAFTGDNPSSLAALCLGVGDVAISLGTSDTVFLSLKEPKPGLDGNIFVNPINSDTYMAMVGFSNGSFPRESVRDKCADGSWDIFNERLANSLCGNFGNIGLFYPMKEISPPLIGVHRYNKAGDRISSFSGHEIEVRAVVEGQMLSRRLHTDRVGYTDGGYRRILATGGASQNKAILQIMADVFHTTVHTMDVSNSAALGGAYRAKHAITGGLYQDVIPGPTLTGAVEPSADAHKVYGPMLQTLEGLENKLLQLTGVVNN